MPVVWCPSCGVRAWVKEGAVVEPVGLACFGRPAWLAWRKHRLCCREPSIGPGRGCPTHSVINRLVMRTEGLRTQNWCTSVVDVTAGRRATLIEAVQGRTASDVSEWIDVQADE